MKKRYKYIRFEYMKEGNVEFYRCYNIRHKCHLFDVEYDIKWKEWVTVEHQGGLVMSVSCHKDTAHFLDQLNTPTTAK